MIRDYSDLLPSYLDGENIRRHSSLIERSDKYLDGLVELFGLWDKLERPILIKREQTTDGGWNEVTLYVNTPTPITEIIIEGDIEETITPEDTVTTTYEGTWTIENPSIDIYTAPPPEIMRVRMPLLTVTVRTETHTYTKTYPENDTIENNSADHDIFLDIVGGLLGIPRRQYAETSLPQIGYFMLTQPHYMAKQVDEADNNIIILPCSEDDYYYYERLNLFVNSQGDHLRLFHTIYDPQAIILKKEDEVIPSELVGTESTVLFTYIQKGALVTQNCLNIDTTNIQEIAEQSLPITRPVQIYPYATIIKYNSTQEVYVNRYKLHLTLGLNAKTIDQRSVTREVPIANLPVNITYEDGTELGTFTTDENGTAHINIDGARSGQQRLRWDLTREYPYFDVVWAGGRNISYDASLFKLSLDDDAWQYKKLADTTVTGFEPASMLSNNNLNCGTGMIAYTPAINPQLVDLTNYNIHIVFHHTNNGQQIRMGTLQETEETAQLMNVLTVRPRQYETGNQPITATHTVDYQFIDGVCHAYFDGTDTGLSKDYSNITDILYIGGYNSTSNSETKGMHFEEISVGDDTRVITELSCTTLNSTTGSASVKATLTANGSGVSGATIECSNGTTLITSNTTDSNGECTLDLSTLQAGNYTLTIEYDGDTTHQATSTTHTINITDPTPTTLNLYGKGQTTGWSNTQWTTIEINAAEEAHCNYTKRNAILKNLPLSGDFTLLLHIQASHNTTWNWGLIPSQSDYSNPAMKVSKGDTLNGSTSIATMFDHGSGVWDTTVPVTVTRSGTTYTLEYGGNSYTFTGSTDTLYLWMDKTGSGNLFLTYIETTATMQ